MTSIVNAAVTAIIAALQSATPVAPQIDRTRLRALKASTTTAVVVRALQSEVTTVAMGFASPTAWSTVIVIECYARASAGAAPDVAVDAVASAAYARLMADPTLGGVLASLTPMALQYDFDADADQTVSAVFTFQARHVAGAQVFTP